MALQNQIHIYSIDTSDFYKKRERKLHNKLNKLYIFRNDLKLRLEKIEDNEDNKILLNNINRCLSTINKSIKYFKNKLCKMLNKNKKIRNLDSRALKSKNIVSVFESTLTRTIQIPKNTLSKDIIIVQTYFFDVIENIIIDGFMFDKEKYVCLTASAGQIRTKKTVFIKESILEQHKNSLMCGLTIERINELGGININKYLAYLALSNSATDEWIGFDITKSIVVDDMETDVKGLVDFINDKTYNITRQEMNIPISHTDGCGMILPSVSSKAFMVRLPWVKGLLIPFPFDKFIKEIPNANCKIKDIYGKEWDIIKDDVKIIFTKSQFKMYKYYKSWEEYCDNFVKYKCQAGKCNEEEDNFADAKINYQMIQTLTDMKDEELKIIATRTNNHIFNIGHDRKTMLKLLGVVNSNTKKNYLQQAIEIYPELLNDTYSKEILKSVKKSLVKDGKACKLEIDGKYTFISPDLYSFCEYLFLGNKNPPGLLKEGEVFCSLYPKINELACLRSPHLFREYAIRNNVLSEENNKWFITKALYVSCHDLISKIIMNDWDGDKSLVCAEPTIIEVAKRNMQDIVPLFYNMAKAGGWIINNKIIFEGLKTAYTGGNIGMISNDITKIWNSGEIDEDKLKVIKLLCMENNFTIDYAKTLYKPERPPEVKKLITNYTKTKVPHFFIYAKNKNKKQVENINNSVVNRLEKIIQNPIISFKSVGLNKFNYKMLMRNKKIKLNNDIINKYTELDLKNRYMPIDSEDGNDGGLLYQYKNIRESILEINSDIYYVVDVLIEYLYLHKKSNYKTTLWSSFGDIIVENLKLNILSKNIYCEKCGELIEQSVNNRKYCSTCAKEIEKSNWVERKRRQRAKCHEAGNL